MKPGDVVWVKCDIDGRGARWRLAWFFDDSQGLMVKFIFEDFEDYAGHYGKFPSVPVQPPGADAPASPADIAALLEQCKTRCPQCMGTGNAHWRLVGGSLRCPDCAGAGYVTPPAATSLADLARGLQAERDEWVTEAVELRKEVGKTNADVPQLRAEADRGRLP